MKRLYIEQSRCEVFLEEGPYCIKVSNRPIVLAASMEQRDRIYPDYRQNEESIYENGLIFFESRFDPIARIRQGYFYKKAECAQPRTLSDYAGNKDILVLGQSDSQKSSRTLECFEYKPFLPSRVFGSNYEVQVLLGYGLSRSRWNVLHVDYTHAREELYTLQLSRPFLNFPQLDQAVIPSDYFDEISNKYMALIDELTASPETVVDQCRDFIVLLLIAKLGLKDKSPDLKKLVELFNEKFKGQYLIVYNCAHIVNRLHPRRKPNEKINLRMRTLIHQDSDLALRCSVMILMELGWNVFNSNTR